MAIERTKKNIEALGFSVPSGGWETMSKKVRDKIEFLLKNSKARKEWFADQGKKNPFDANAFKLALDKKQKQLDREAKFRKAALYSDKKPTPPPLKSPRAKLASEAARQRKAVGRPRPSNVDETPPTTKQKKLQSILRNVGSDDTKPPTAEPIAVDKQLTQAKQAVVDKSRSGGPPRDPLLYQVQGTDTRFSKRPPRGEALAQPRAPKIRELTSKEKRLLRGDNGEPAVKSKQPTAEQQRLLRGSKVKPTVEEDITSSRRPPKQAETRTRSEAKTLEQLEKTVGAAQRKGDRDFNLKGKRLAAVTKEQLKKSGLTLTEYLNKADKERSARAKAKKAHGGMTKSKSRNGHTDFRGGGMMYNTAVKRG